MPQSGILLDDPANFEVSQRLADGVCLVRTVPGFSEQRLPELIGPDAHVGIRLGGFLEFKQFPQESPAPLDEVHLCLLLHSRSILFHRGFPSTEHEGNWRLRMTPELTKG